MPTRVVVKGLPAEDPLLDTDSALIVELRDKDSSKLMRAIIILPDGSFIDGTNSESNFKEFCDNMGLSIEKG